MLFQNMIIDSVNTLCGSNYLFIFVLLEFSFEDTTKVMWMSPYLFEFWQTTSKRVAEKKVAKFQRNITKRGSVPERSSKKGYDYPVGPILLGFFIFVVIGSCLHSLPIISSSSSHNYPWSTLSDCFHIHHFHKALCHSLFHSNKNNARTTSAHGTH